MNILIAGSTGMIGNLVLTNCLNTVKISKVTALVRQPTGLQHDKLTEIVVRDWEDYSQMSRSFEDIHTAFFCVGVYTGQVPDALFQKITVNFVVAFAKSLERGSPGAALVLLSGAGADRTEKSRTPFARYKGMAENQIAALQLKLYAFRPGYIYPVESRKEPNALYTIMRLLYPLIRLFGKNMSIKSTELANAMVAVGLNGSEKQIFENAAIRDYK